MDTSGTGFTQDMVLSSTNMRAYPISGLQQFCQFRSTCSEEDVENAIKEYTKQDWFGEKTAKKHIEDLKQYLLSKIGRASYHTHNAYIRGFCYDYWCYLSPLEVKCGRSIPVSSDQFDYEPDSYSDTDSDAESNTGCMTDTEVVEEETTVTLEYFLKD